MSIDYNAIGNRIKIARNKQEYTQAHLAELLSVSPEYISRIERGSTHLSLSTLVEIAGHLSVSSAHLIEGASTNDSTYTLDEFSEIVRGLSPEKRRLLLEIAKVVAKEN